MIPCFVLFFFLADGVHFCFPSSSSPALDEPSRVQHCLPSLVRLQTRESACPPDLQQAASLILGHSPFLSVRRLRSQRAGEQANERAGEDGGDSVREGDVVVVGLDATGKVLVDDCSKGEPV